MDHLLTSFKNNSDQDAIVWRDEVVSYARLLARIEFWQRETAGSIGAGSVVSLHGDFSPEAIALFLALVGMGCVVVPLTRSRNGPDEELMDVAQAEFSFTVDDADEVTWSRTGRRASHDHYRTLQRSDRPGLVLFSSGSTGVRKGAVHDMDRILEKFKTARKPMRAIGFLLFDHIGGVNTMLHILSNGGCLVGLTSRNPDVVLATIEKHRVEVLPTSPSFLNLILLSEAHRRHDLTSLRLITYGTEPMPKTTLARIGALLPEVRLLQTYGLSELGILRSKSRSSESLWVKVGGEGFETRIVDGILQIRAHSAMLGYLNAPSPFDEDGWFDTGDQVEVDGDYLRIIGRRSEFINVGGEKVHPVEVENVILELEEVADVTVFAEANSILGEIVCARVQSCRTGNHSELTRAVREHCRRGLEPFMVPMKIQVSCEQQHGERFKKLRRSPEKRD